MSLSIIESYPLPRALAVRPTRDEAQALLCWWWDRYGPGWDDAPLPVPLGTRDSVEPDIPIGHVFDGLRVTACERHGLALGFGFLHRALLGQQPCDWRCYHCYGTSQGWLRPEPDGRLYTYSGTAFALLRPMRLGVRLG